MPTPIQRLLRISPQQLRSFEATARLTSITQAARELHVSQPTVSVQLRELSALIGEPLFEPLGRGVRLTPAGEALQATVGEIAECWRRFEGNLSELSGLLRGRLRIAAVTTAEYFVPELLGLFAARHPGVEIDLAIENRDRVIARLRRQSDDLAVMMLPPDDLPLHTLSLRANPLVVIAPRDHPLRAHPRPLPLSALTQARWLMREVGSGTRLVAERHFAEHGFEPRVLMSLGSNEALKRGVGAGLGLGVISALALKGEVGEAGDTGEQEGVGAGAAWAPLAVETFPIARQWSLVWRSDSPLTPAAQRLLVYLQASRSFEGAPAT